MSKTDFSATKETNKYSTEKVKYQRLSILRISVGSRLAIAALGSLLIWLTIGWALK